MKILFIGGTGNISGAASQLAIEKGMDLYHLNRGITKSTIPKIKSIQADINDPNQINNALHDQSWDVVVNWIAFDQHDIDRDIQLFRGRTGQYIFISSASCYQKPLIHPVITESTPLKNPFWDYSQNKIKAEDRLIQAYRNEDFPMTIVRPSLTYDTVIPIAIGGFKQYTTADRILKGEKIIVHGDGNSLWTVTHADDFAKGFTGLMGLPQAIGHAFHITSDEILTWNSIYQVLAQSLGCTPNIVHIPTDFICKIEPTFTGTLKGDKSESAIFNNAKIKEFVPEFKATIPFARGIKQTLHWLDEHPKLKNISSETNGKIERIIKAYAQQQ